MRKLLSADFYRLGRDKAFWIGALAMLAYTVGAMLSNCHQAMEDVESGFPYALETFYFVYALLIGLLISVFTSLFLGSEYSDGTIRNKLVVGHKRSDVYLSKLFANIAFSLILLFFGLLGGLCGIISRVMESGQYDLGIPAGQCIFYGVLCGGLYPDRDALHQ